MQVKQIPGERRSSFEERRRFVKQAEKMKLRGRFEPHQPTGNAANREMRRKHPDMFELKKAGEDPDKV